MPEKNYLLAHDLGTSGLKASLVALDGRIVSSHTEPYPMSHPRPGWTEQNPEDWWKAFCACNEAVLRGIGPGEIAGVSLTGQMMCCLPVSGGGKPLRPAITWADSRAVSEAESLSRKLGDRAGGITGLNLSANYTLPKIMWLMRHEPEIYRETAAFLSPKDYLNYRLTGIMATDPENAAYMYCWDRRGRGWSSALLEAAGADAGKLPAAIPAGTPLGVVSASADCGLKPGTPVVMGTGDGGATTLGTAVIEPGEAYTSLGTSGWVSAVTAGGDYDPATRISKLNYLNHCRDSGTMQAGGFSYGWLRDTVCGGMDYAGIDRLAARSPAGAGGVLYHPYLLGERAPFWDTSLRASFLGLSARTTRAELCRSVLEGVALQLSLILKAIKKNSDARPVCSMKLVGGGASSPLWRQIFADVYGMPVSTVKQPDQAAALGLAVMTGTALGIYGGVDIVRQFQPVCETALPDAERAELYRKQGEIFLDAVDALKAVSRRLTNLHSTKRS